MDNNNICELVRKINNVRNESQQFKEESYLFVLEVVNFSIEKMGILRHMAAKELMGYYMDFLIDKFGIMSLDILENWNIHKTYDIGIIVFDLIDLGLLRKTKSDKIKDFYNLFDFSEEFRKKFKWDKL